MDESILNFQIARNTFKTTAYFNTHLRDIWKLLIIIYSQKNICKFMHTYVKHEDPYSG